MNLEMIFIELLFEAISGLVFHKLPPLAEILFYVMSVAVLFILLTDLSASHWAIQIARYCFLCSFPSFLVALAIRR